MSKVQDLSLVNGKAEMNGVRVITTKMIAEKFGKENKDVVRVIKDNLKNVDIIFTLGLHYFVVEKEVKSTGDNLSPVEITSQLFPKRSYHTEAFLLTERGFNKLVMGFRGKRADEAKEHILDVYFAKAKTRRGVPTPLQLAEQVVELYRQKELDQKLIEKQSQKIELKTDIIEGFTKNTTPYQKRQLISRIVKQSNSSLISLRYNELYKAYQETYHSDLKRLKNNYNAKQEKKKDHLNSLAYAEKFGHIDNLYMVACKIYETDILAIIQKSTKAYQETAVLCPGN